MNATMAEISQQLGAALDEEKSVQVTKDQLGGVMAVHHRGLRLLYRLPIRIESTATLRFKGCGKMVAGQTGDLLLQIKLIPNSELAL